MIPDSPAPGIVIRAPDKTSTRESGDEASNVPPQDRSKSMINRIKTFVNAVISIPCTKPSIISSKDVLIMYVKCN